MDDKTNFTTIDEYIAMFTTEVQELLTQMRETIRKFAPDAQEKISWQMPTFYLNGNLVHFAAFKKHIGFYPGADGIEYFKDKMSEYKTSKGAVQFPFDKPLPLELVGEIVQFRVEQNEAKSAKLVKTKGDNNAIKLICYSKCTTCQKAKKWLEAKGISFENREIKEDNPTYEELKEWVSKSGMPLRKFFNTSGLVYKNLNLKEKLQTMTEDEQLELLATDGMLVKRPILVAVDCVLVGFNQAEWEEKI